EDRIFPRARGARGFGARGRNTVRRFEHRRTADRHRAEHDRRRPTGSDPAHVRARQLRPGAEMSTGERTGRLSPVLTAVLANRFDVIVREMTNTLFRTGRSAVLNMARDFSCCIVTAENELLTAAEGLQAHVLGAGLQTSSMTRSHPD